MPVAQLTTFKRYGFFLIYPFSLMSWSLGFVLIVWRLLYSIHSYSSFYIGEHYTHCCICCCLWFLTRQGFHIWGALTSSGAGLSIDLTSTTSSLRTVTVSSSKYIYIYWGILAIVSLYYCSQDYYNKKGNYYHAGVTTLTNGVTTITQGVTTITEGVTTRRTFSH